MTSTQLASSESQSPAPAAIPSEPFLASEAETKTFAPVSAPVVLTDAERSAIAAAKADGRVPFTLVDIHESLRYGTGKTDDGQNVFVHASEFATLRVETDPKTGPALVVAPVRRTTIPTVGTTCIAGSVADPLEGKKNPRAIRFATLANYMAATAHLATAQKNWEADRKAAQERAVAKKAAEEARKARRAEVAAQLCESRVKGVNGDGISVVAMEVVYVSAEKNFAIAVDAANREYFLAGSKQGSLVLSSASCKIENVYVPAAGATLPVKGEVVYAPSEGIRTGSGKYPKAEGWMKREVCLKQIERLTAAAKKAAETLAAKRAAEQETQKKRLADIAEVAATHRQPKSGGGNEFGGGTSKKSRNQQRKNAKRQQK